MIVEIWSDFVCPFCYIGKRKLEEALAQFPHKDHVVKEFRSYELNPHADSSGGVSTYAMLAQKYGMSLEQAKATSSNVAQQAAAVGLEFRFDGMMEQNTFDAHRVAHFAASQGQGDAAAERLFRAYFTENDRIDSHDRLVELAAEAGLNKEEVKGMLLSGQFTDSVKEQEEEGSRLGIRGVPFFVFDRKYAVSGAQSPEVFLDTLNKAWEKKHPTFVQVREAPADAQCGDGYCAPGTEKS